MPRKKKQTTDDLFEALTQLGWTEKPKQPKEITYRTCLESGNYQVLKATPSLPWDTVQERASNNHVKWFVDFPGDVPTKAVVAFVTELTGEKVQTNKVDKIQTTQ